MSLISKIPGLRILKRVHEYAHRLAPLQNFSDYDAYWKSRAKDRLVARELDRFKIISNLIEDGSSVLDIGCGDCSFQKYLSSVKPGCRLLGLDTSCEAVNLAQRKGFNAQLIDTKIPLRGQVDGKWDVVTMMEIIEHVPDAEDLVRQVLELKPKRIFITIPNVGCLKHRIRLMFGGRFPITCVYYHMKEHVRFWTVKDFHQWAEYMGLIVEDFHGQFDHGDAIVEWFVRKIPSVFADRVIYEMRTNIYKND